MQTDLHTYHWLWLGAWLWIFYWMSFEGTWRLLGLGMWYFVSSFEPWPWPLLGPMWLIFTDLYLKETLLVWHCMTFVLFVNTSISWRYVDRLSKYCIIQLVKRFRGQGLGPKDLVRDIIQIVWVSAKMHNFQWNCIIIGFRGSKRVNVSTISTYWCSCLLFNGTRLKNWLAMSLQLIQYACIFSFFYTT